MAAKKNLKIQEEKEQREGLSIFGFDIEKYLQLNESTISMVLGVLVVVVTVGLIVNYWKSTRPPRDTIVAVSPTPTNTEVKLVQKEDGTKVPENLPKAHSVAKGETLWAIAMKYYGSGYNWVDVAEKNKLRAPYKIAAGQELVIPQVSVKEPKKRTAIASVKVEAIVGDKYAVVKGDSLWAIAVRAYGDGFKWLQIAKANKLKNPNVILVGQELVLPR